MTRLAGLAALLALPIAARATEPILLEPGPAGRDTAVYRFLPDSPRDPDSPSLYAFSSVSASGAHDFRSFVHFEMPADLGGVCVEKAELFVFYGFAFSGFGEGDDAPGTLLCEPVLADWSEAGMTWNTQPPRGAAVDVIEGIESFGYLACDLTGLVQAWLDGAPNFGVALSSPTGRVMGFYSFEAQVDPVLRPALAITPADDSFACPEPAAAGGIALTALARLATRRRS